MNLFLAYQLVNLKTLVSFRLNVVLAITANLIHYGTSIFFISFLLGKSRTLAGWNKDEVFFLYALALLSFSLFGLFGQSLAQFGATIIRGELDRVLLRPQPVYLQVVLSGTNLIYATHFVFSVVLLYLSVSQLQLELGVWIWIYLIVSVALASVLQLAFGMIASGASFWVSDSSAIFNILIYTSREMIWYPIDIYAKFLRNILLFVIPFGVINFVPASFVLGKPGFGVSDPMSYLQFVVVPLVFLAASRLNRAGLERYSSSGH